MSSPYARLRHCIVTVAPYTAAISRFPHSRTARSSLSTAQVALSGAGAGRLQYHSRETEDVVCSPLTASTLQRSYIGGANVQLSYSMAFSLSQPVESSLFPNRKACNFRYERDHWRPKVQEHHLRRYCMCAIRTFIPQSEIEWLQRRHTVRP